ncbi:uncharacterized protein A4U43_C08F19980 [Asparagus officinalis]|nr:uncharacterized protein A4U43_C08F19980 [Asparagus officinalis]
MKESDLLPTLSTAPAATATKPETSSPSLFGKGRYKFWALAAIALLAFWSMLTGTVSLRSSGDLSSDDLLLRSQQSHADLDILEVEEREEVVRRKWEVYSSQSRRIRLPRFGRSGVRGGVMRAGAHIRFVQRFSNLLGLATVFVWGGWGKPIDLVSLCYIDVTVDDLRTPIQVMEP